MRKFLTLFLAAATLLLFPAFTFAKVPQPGDPGVRVAKFWAGKSYYEINGQRFQMDVAPYIKNGRTLLPVRYVGYALGVAPEDITWDPAKQKATLKRWWGKEEDLGHYDSAEFTVGNTKFFVNEDFVSAILDQPPEIKDGRVMLPMRAAVHALGGMCFWDAKERSVTVETWKKLPQPVPYMVKEVAVPRDKAVATVVYTDGRKVEVKTARPIVTNEQGFSIDAIEWFKLWGVPESAMIFDSNKRGLLVRGGAVSTNFQNYNIGKAATSCVALYVGEKGYWSSGSPYDRYPKESDKDEEPMIIKNGILWGGNAVLSGVARLWGGCIPIEAHDVGGVISAKL